MKVTESKLRDMIKKIINESEYVPMSQKDLDATHDYGRGISKVKSLKTGKPFTTTTDRLRKKRIGETENKLKKVIRKIIKEVDTGENSAEQSDAKIFFDLHRDIHDALKFWLWLDKDEGRNQEAKKFLQGLDQQIAAFRRKVFDNKSK